MHRPTSSFAALATLLATTALTSNAFTVPTSSSPSAYRTSQLSMSSSSSHENPGRRSVLTTTAAALLGTAVVTQSPDPSYARLEAVNRPDLLPSEPGQNVIQVEKFLTTGQQARMEKQLAALERDTGFRVRVLCQAYPQTPGLAVRDYWDLGKEGQKDDKYIVLVVDQFGGKGNVLNFNVGEGIKFALPNIFWTRLQAKYGTTFFVRENGLDVAITNAIEAVVTCLRSEEQFCVNVPEEFSMKSLSM